MGLRVAAFALLGLALVRPALALDPQKSLADCTVQVWRVRDGLPAAWVRAMAQSPDGYLWIATSGGLGRLDGAEAVTIPADPPLGRLSDVMDVAVASDGTLWVLPSFGEPVCRQERTLGACGGKPAVPTMRPYLVTEGPPGTIWIAAREGLYRHAGGQLALVYAAAALPFQRANAIHADGQRLWVGAQNGLFVQEGGRFRAYAGPDGFAPKAVQAFHQRGNQLWAAAAEGLLRIDLESGAAVAHPHAFPGRPIQVIEDRDGNLWIGGYGGLVRFREGTFTTFTVQDGLPDDDVTALFEDREGSLWVGTRTGGLAQFSDRTVNTRAGPPSLRGERVETLAEGPPDTFWFGSHRGVTRWRAGEERTFDRGDGLPSNNVSAVLPEASGGLWVGTDRGLARLREGRFVTVAEGAVLALYLDPDGTLWVGTDQGLGRLEGERLRLVPNHAEFDPGAIRAIQRDRRGVLWAATGSGLARVDKGVLTRVRGENVNLRHARALHLDPAGVLWIATARNGLIRMVDGRTQAFGPAQGMTFDQLYQLLTDDQGFLWVGTSRGIVRLDKQALEQVARGQRQRVDPIWLDTSDERRDLSVTRSHQPGVWKSRDGRLWFASDQGMVTIDPRRLRLDTVPPPVWIEDLQVDGRFARRDEPHSFPPGAGNVEFHFTGVTLLEPAKVAHRYRLDGFDDRWVDAGTRRAAYYTNLPPGRYRFRVQARNVDGVWNERGDSVELTLAPHLYQRVWFWGLAAVALAALVLAAHRARLARVRAQYQAVLAERGRVARELHDSLLQGMSAVAMQIYGLRKRLGPSAPPRPPETLARELQSIEEVVTAGLEETRRFVWNLREPVADEPLPVALEKLLDRLTERTGVARELVVEGKAVRLPADVEGELSRIVQEAVSNALKHAEARHIVVRLCYEGGGVQLSISDDGRGFDPDQAPGASAGHFGLVGIRERAARLGQLTVESRPGEGTRIAVTVSAERASQDGEGHV
jgi:signal transduction histidine kinase/ligand-binding sensor domain-containing protein